MVSITMILAIIWFALATEALRRTRQGSPWVSSSGPEHLSFSVPVGDPVAMFIHDSVYYDPVTERGALEYGYLMPSGGHTVHITRPQTTTSQSKSEVHTVALFHRLKCLQIMGHQFVAPELPISPLTKHCINYLRESILCRLNLRLESVKNTIGHVNRGPYDAKCKDWTLVYAEAERNYELFKAGNHTI